MMLTYIAISFIIVAFPARIAIADYLTRRKLRKARGAGPRAPRPYRRPRSSGNGGSARSPEAGPSTMPIRFRDTSRR
jgi:hypothetical protein